MKFEHQVTLRGITNSEAEKWLEEQGWHRLQDWIYTGCYSTSGLDYWCHYRFNDANQAMLCKLTWGGV